MRLAASVGSLTMPASEGDMGLLRVSAIFYSCLTIRVQLCINLVTNLQVELIQRAQSRHE